MPGKWIALALAFAVLVAFGCRKVPTANDQQPLPASAGIFLQRVAQPEFRTALTRIVATYEREPTGEHAADVWAAFANVDERLSSLKRDVGRLAGGARAEAEIERLELQRIRDNQMERFARTQARVRHAQIAFSNLAASLNRREGVRAAASMITRDFRSDAELFPGLRGLQGRVQRP